MTPEVAAGPPNPRAETSSTTDGATCPRCHGSDDSGDNEVIFEVVAKVAWSALVTGSDQDTLHVEWLARSADTDFLLPRLHCSCGHSWVYRGAWSAAGEAPG